MIKIQRFEVNMFQENCYVASDDTKECVIIDCGAFHEEERKAITDYIRSNGLTPKHLLATHGHIDHNFGNDTVFNEFALKPEVYHSDEILMNNLRQQAFAFLRLDYKRDIPTAGKLFDESYPIKWGSHTFSVIHTPGHTPGSVMFYCKEEGIAFSGDTLFKMSIGRTDFELGSYKDIINSLHKASKLLPPDTTVLPGHGEQTTIGFELKHNPYIKQQ